MGLLWANLPADFDNDGDVDFSDFVAFAGKFGTAQGDEAYDEIYDINRDGRVDFTDYTEFSAEFGNNIHGDKHALTPEELEQNAKAHRESGNYKEAAKSYRAMIINSESDLIKARGIRGLGTVYVAMDSLAQAERQFKHALAEYGESENNSIKYQVMWCSIQLGIVKETQRDRFKALEYLNRARTYLP